ncbi:MAG: amino acid adenylation domain-containing protein [Chitinophagaceae bacterium]
MLWVEASNIKLFVADNFKDSNSIIAEIKTNKSAIVEYLVANNIFSREDFQQKTIFMSGGNTAALSFAQERLWFIEQYEAGSNAYHIPLVIEPEPGTNIDGIKYALQQIVARHEVLRTTIEQPDAEERGVQYVHDEPLYMKEITLAPGEHIKSLLEEDISRPFDLGAEYPIRVSFFTVPATEQSPGCEVLLIVFHHIASDGWSLDIFQREWTAYYDAYCNNDFHFELPPLEIQYKDYAAWQRSYLSGNILEKQLSYWKNKLAGYQPLELPSGYARPAAIDYRGASVYFTLDLQVSQQLRILAQRYGVTLYSTLLSTVNILLGKYTGQQDIVTGSVIANRHQRQTQDLIGFFVNTQVNRTQLQPGQSFEDLVQQVHQEQAQAQMYQDLPFEKLVVELGVERDPSRHPIFQVMFGTENYGRLQQEEEITAQHISLQSQITYHVEKFDLSVNIDDSEPEIRGRISYATALFSKDSIDRFISHYTCLLAQLVAAPEMPYSRHSLLGPLEYDQLVHEWNATDNAFPEDKTIYQLFEEQAARTPDYLAVVFEGESLGYQQLNEKGNQLARHIRTQYLQKTGQALTPDTIIALYLERGLEMLVSILAVQKAGGAYAPMDTQYPQERIDYLLEDTGAALILTHRKLSDERDVHLPSEKIIYTDLEASCYSAEETSNLPAYGKATDLAYVIYTSGTTGRPKGVMIEQRAVVNLITDLLTRYNIDSAERILLFANYVFDASVEQMYLSLLSGAALYIITNNTITDSNLFEDYISKKQITHLHATPSFLSSINPFKLGTLKRVIFGAEYLTKELFCQYQPFVPDVINEYGPTETTITALVSMNSCLLSRATIQNTKAYILDAALRPVPVGVTGELYLGGAGLARGYLNNPDQTAERFIANPFNEKDGVAKEGSRLYKTGDLVRWRPDGSMEYFGRNDDQVKIRGFRIETGEIEHALLQVNGIKKCCVTVKEKKTASVTSKYLVAYYTTEENNGVLSQVAIRDRLLQLLPGYMVPVSFVAIETFPLTVNGKLDKRALPDPDFTTPEADYIAPLNEIEAVLCKIWEAVLGLDQVSVTDDFFRVGGDSILSIQVSGRIRQAGFNCQVKEIFEYRTIAKLAEQLGKKIIDPAIHSEQGILTGNAGLLPVQQWFFEKVQQGLFRRPHHWNQSFLVRVPALDAGKLPGIIEELVAYHDVMRMKFSQPAAGSSAGKGINRWGQSYQSSIAIPALRTVDVSKHTETTIHELLSSWQSDFDLEKGPLFQAGYLYGYEDNSARIYFAMHHLLIDAVSWGIIADDIKTLYAGKKLPAKGSSYRQWTETIKDYTTQHPAEAIYWKKQLDNIATYPVKYYEQEPSETFFELDKTLTRSLLQQASRAYHTEINDLLLTALAYALREINQNDIQCITLEGHGREEINDSIDHSRTVGWFTTMFPVKLQLQNNLAESIQYIKESLRNIPGKGIGFGAFATNPANAFTQQDLAPISFNYLSQFDVAEGEWQIVGEDSGESMHPANTDHNLVNINGMVSNGKLWFSIVTRLGAATTQQLGECFQTELKRIIDHCKEKLQETGSSYTPSDFKTVSISQALLDQLQTNAKENQNAIAHIYPANSLQQGFIYHALSKPEDDAYRVQLAYDYHQALDTARYLKAWGHCIAQYPILRTAFNWEEDIIQVIYKYGKLHYQEHDISHLTNQHEKDAVIAAIQAADRERSFDLTKPTLLRLHIIRQSADYYTILKSEHHSISDGWSSQLLFTNLNYYYHELISNKRLHITEDVAYLEAQEYISNNKSAVENYWEEAMSKAAGTNNIDALLSIPIGTDIYQQVEKPATCTLELTGQNYESIKAFSQQEGITLNVIIQFTWHKLLSVYSNSLQSIVGTTVSGRDLPVEGIEESVGLYINTLPLIVDWDNDNNVREQLHQIQQKVTALNTHSFAELATLQKDGERLFHSLFVYENYPVPKASGEIPGTEPEIPVQEISLRSAVEKVTYPLGIIAYEFGDTITIHLEYDGSHLTNEKAQQHLETLRRIIYQVVKNPGKPQREISLLDDEAYKKIIYQWNDTATAFPNNKTIGELFQEQAAKTPGNIALLYKNRPVTYKELNEKSNQLARHIRKQYLQRTQQEFKADTVIALFLDRSAAMVTGILAILKAGGAYLPIDINYPQERIDYMLQETGAELILCLRQSEQPGNTSLPGEKILYIDEEESLFHGEDSSNLALYSEAANLAYVIYTSGTTGKPKGVMIEQSAVTSLVFNDYIQLNSRDVFAFLSSPVFDATTFELWTPLLNGNRLVIPQDLSTLIADINAFSSFISDNAVSVLWLTKTLFESLFHLNNEIFKNVRYLITGGEALERYSVDKLINSPAKPLHFLNGYGPTESTTFTCMFDLSNSITSDNIPIGKPVKNRTTYVLDPGMNPVPVGVTGELYIGGAGIARGYLQGGELTAARFIRNPFAAAAGLSGNDRLYKTGDLVRWLPDGNLEYIGRNDEQVKIMGYRIETGEIEHALSGIPGIRQSCVLVAERATAAGTLKYLVGYYSTDGSDTAPGEADIAGFLSQVLPAYMVPGAWVEMESFPVTLNGKLDKKALPGYNADGMEDDYIAPSTETEIKICNIWQQALELAQVGITDNFFRIGGNSILAIQVSHRMSKTLGYDVKVSDVFTLKTIQALLNSLSVKRINPDNVEWDILINA